MVKPKGKKTVWTRIKNAFDVILTVFIALIALVEIVAFATKGSNYNVPSFFGYQTSVVITDSMAYDEDGKSLYPVGIGIVCKKKSFSEVKVGDDVFFHAYIIGSVEGVSSSEAEINIIHRVFGEGVDSSGTKFYLAHGVNTKAVNYNESQAQVIYETKPTSSITSYTYKDKSYTINARGVLLGSLVSASSALGGFILAMQTPWAIALLIIIPCLIIAISSIIDIVKIKNTPDEELAKKYLGTDGTKAADKPNDLSGFSEEEKKKLKEQMLNEMLNSSKSEGENKEEKK